MVTFVVMMQGARAACSELGFRADTYLFVSHANFCTRYKDQDFPGVTEGKQSRLLRVRCSVASKCVE